jgi:hypothetical protein
MLPAQNDPSGAAAPSLNRVGSPRFGSAGRGAARRFSTLRAWRSAGREVEVGVVAAGRRTMSC